MKMKDKMLSIFLVIALLVTFVPMDIAADIFKSGNEIIRMQGNNEKSNFDKQKEDNKLDEDKKQEDINSNKETEGNKEESDKNEDNQNTQEDIDKNEETDKDSQTNSNTQEEDNQNEPNHKLDWPEKPSWITHRPKPLNLESGENKSYIYAIPKEGITNEDINKLEDESANMRPIESRDNITSKDKLENFKVDGYINGKKIENSSDIKVKKGDKFSFNLSWGPIKGTNSDADKIKEGDYIEKEIFTVPNLSFDSKMENVLSIVTSDNRKKVVGNATCTYDKTSGKMTYRVTFKENINLFDYNTVFSYYEASASFDFTEKSDGEFNIFGNKGQIHFEKEEQKPTPRPPHEGEGWKPGPLPPEFKPGKEAFRKNWSFNNASEADKNQKRPIIEWRITFVDKIQEEQEKYLKEHPIKKPDENIIEKAEGFIGDIKDKIVYNIEKFKNKVSNTGTKQGTDTNGNYIIEDELNENMRFSFKMYNHVGNSGNKIANQSPFYLEIPLMVAGSKIIINQFASYGRPWELVHQGNGYIDPYIQGLKFTHVVTQNDIDKETEIEKEENDGINNNDLKYVKRIGPTIHTVSSEEEKESYVKKTPGTYTILNQNNFKKKEKLIINVGNIEDPNNNFLKFEKSSEPNGLDRLNKEVVWSQEKIDELNRGDNSPIALVKRNYNRTKPILERAKALPDEKNPQELKNKVDEFINDFESKFINLSNNEKLDDTNIPDINTLKSIEDSLKINAEGKLLKDSAEYKDLKKSFENIKENQNTKYLETMDYSKKLWESAKQRYQVSYDFYKEKGILGFVVKVPTEVVNTSKKSFNNKATVYNGKERFSADATEEADFNSGIVGTFDIGSIVIQKKFDGSDKYDESTLEKLKNITFNLICDDTQKVAKFDPKEQSENKNTYDYNENGTVTDLKLNSEPNNNYTGKFSIINLLKTHDHTLKEISDVPGYYKDKITIKKEDIDDLKVNYIEFNNISRSVKILKEDSFSGHGIVGTKFELHKGDNKDGELVTGFTKKEINGHTAYWYDKKGTDVLTTYSFEKNKAGLCIHGLDAGTYTLVETNASSGYEKEEKSVTFELKEERPTEGLDNQNHVVKDINNQDLVIKNNSNLASLEFTKLDGNKKENTTLIDKVKNLLTNNDFEGHDPLDGVLFTLYRFNGSDEDWKERPEGDVSKFEKVEFNKEKKYFTTSNETIKEHTVNRPGHPLIGQKVPAIKTGANGKVNITNIPKGYYCLYEVEPKDGYHLAYKGIFFKVTGEENGANVKLYRELNKGEDKVENPFTDEIPNNGIFNFKRLLKLKLIKYEEGQKPTIDDGNKLDAGKYGDDTYRYDAVTNGKGLKGATYKLFLAESEDEHRPNPEELKPENAEKIVSDKIDGYDVIKGIGTTDDNGELDISKFKDEKGNPIVNDNHNGLHLGNYYLIETKAPDGYMLNQKPISFKFDRDIFEQNTDSNNPNYNNIGILKLAPNKKGESAVRIKKVDAKYQNPLSGAEFVIYEKNIKDIKDSYLKVESIGDGEYKVSTSSTPETNVLGKIKNKIVNVIRNITNKDENIKNQVDNYNEIPKNSIMTTNKEGTFRLRGLKANTDYVIKEVKAPQGYTLTDELFEFKAPTEAKNTDTDITDDNGIITISKVVENIISKGSVAIEKIDSETKRPLYGAEFTLYKKVKANDVEPLNESDSDSKYKEIGKYETDSEGKIDINDLEWGEYYLVETKAPHGYELKKTRYYFTVDKDFKEKIVITAKNSTLGSRDVELIKKDSKGNPLKDISFKLEIAEESETGEIKWLPYDEVIYKTNDDGVIKLTLPYGKYRLTEQKTDANNGYVVLEKPIEFNVEKDKENQPAIPIKLNVKNFKQDEAKDIIYIKKKLMYNNQDTEFKLKGIEFNVFDKETDGNKLSFKEIGKGVYQYTGTDKDTVTNIATDANGEIQIAINSTTLNKNSLYLEEVNAPEGVDKLNGRKKIEFKDNNNWADVDIENNYSGQIEIEIVKEGENKKPLKGAEFTIYGEKDGNKGEKIISYVTDEKGKVSFTKDKVNFEIGKTYYIEETKAPEGYIKDNTVEKIKIDKNIFEQKENKVLVKKSYTATNSKIKGSLKILKVDKEGKKPLEGAEFEIFRKTSGKLSFFKETDEKEEQNKVSTPETDPSNWQSYGRYITDEKGEININNLSIGDYYYIERTAPMGYEVSDSAKGEFIVDKDGALTQSIELTVENIKIKDANGSIKLKKVDKDKKDILLSGAKFLLYHKDEKTNEYVLYGHKQYTTNQNGEITINNLPVGKYYLEEIESPDGYYLSQILENNRFYFEIKAGDNQLKEITAENTKAKSGNVTLEKTDSKDKNIKLSGAEFRLYYGKKKEDNSIEYIPYDDKTYVTDEKGILKIENLLSGDYMIEEVKAPKGYILPNPPKNRTEFTISGDKDVVDIRLDIVNEKESGGGGGGTVVPKPDPDKPVDPDKPDKPDKPVDPDKPDKPDKPVDPNKPDKPDKPVDPNKPNKPDNPNDSGNPSKPNKPSITSKIPKTGDSAQLLATGAVFIGAGAGLFAIRRNNKKTITRSGRRSRKNRRKRK